MDVKNAKIPLLSRAVLVINQCNNVIIVAEAKHREALEKEEQRIVSQNELGSYIFNLGTTIPNQLNDIIQDAIIWLEGTKKRIKRN
ncbi:8570_t:CDS:2 [Funneliformis caledonium]|uniref:8570_t:CDS:1 n=1 Tax=Funneliformis caledonium TaxID=1117310 RepID=A0A9N9F5M4_9GLOM|nr:8570_t:CDS:2 [Funneliformis caledonium]